MSLAQGKGWGVMGPPYLYKRICGTGHQWAITHELMGRVGEGLSLDGQFDRGVKPLLQEEKWVISRSKDDLPEPHHFTCAGATRVASGNIRARVT
ncbi:MAG: hypothetical protein DRP71_13090 [Verrucomicrobia bacterium]|nr:MAG: hypothetical protein DRP71_13090 [Verrucomicrobiota bacterium]